MYLTTKRRDSSDKAVAGARVPHVKHGSGTRPARQKLLHKQPATKYMVCCECCRKRPWTIYRLFAIGLTGVPGCRLRCISCQYTALYTVRFQRFCLRMVTLSFLPNACCRPAAFSRMSVAWCRGERDPGAPGELVRPLFTSQRASLCRVVPHQDPALSGALFFFLPIKSAFTLSRYGNKQWAIFVMKSVKRCAWFRYRLATRAPAAVPQRCLSGTESIFS